MVVLVDDEFEFSCAVALESGRCRWQWCHCLIPVDAADVDPSERICERAQVSATDGAGSLCWIFPRCCWSTFGFRKISEFFQHEGFDWKEMNLCGERSQPKRETGSWSFHDHDRCARSIFLWQGR